VAYEMMQTYHADAATRFYSLDDIYYFGGQNAHNQEAIMEHTPRETASSTFRGESEELELRVGDLIGVAGNHWNGYSKGVNRRTGKTGLYPSYKVRDYVEQVEFPVYPNVPLRKGGDGDGGDKEEEHKKAIS
jgi:glycoprotein 6-alpha-L-fucosyltransferase